ncbi:hypothetical protein CEXT_177321 [Caerostris extrusa]|uniref:Ycf15 n=1 Tax=Caerostris extrusa TaxID=172846 RepID=A0AAV4MQX3_CAEEX|nr:hypothetical protein CEXT_177321 [Caerostris extrusa]
MSMDCLRTGDKADVHFRSLKILNIFERECEWYFVRDAQSCWNRHKLIPNATPSNMIMRSKPIKMRPSSASPTEMLGRPENEPRKPSKRSGVDIRGSRMFVRILLRIQ